MKPIPLMAFCIEYRNGKLKPKECNVAVATMKGPKARNDIVLINIFKWSGRRHIPPVLVFSKHTAKRSPDPTPFGRFFLLPLFVQRKLTECCPDLLVMAAAYGNEGTVEGQSLHHCPEVFIATKSSGSWIWQICQKPSTTKAPWLQTNG